MHSLYAKEPLGHSAKRLVIILWSVIHRSNYTGLEQEGEKMVCDLSLILVHSMIMQLDNQSPSPKYIAHKLNMK